jgi:hypothetical protein
MASDSSHLTKRPPHSATNARIVRASSSGRIDLARRSYFTDRCAKNFKLFQRLSGKGN